MRWYVDIGATYRFIAENSAENFLSIVDGMVSLNIVDIACCALPAIALSKQIRSAGVQQHDTNSAYFLNFCFVNI